MVLHSKHHIRMPRHIAQLRALVIEDNRTSAMAMRTLLEKIGFQSIDLAATPNDATELCLRQQYQLVLVDYHLDGKITGSELLMLLKQQNRLGSNCATIMASGDSTPAVILSSMDATPDSFIRKPVSLRALHDKVAYALYQSEMRAPVLAALSQGEDALALTRCKSQLSHYGAEPTLYHLMLNLLMKRNAWTQVRHYAEIFSVSKSSPFIEVMLARCDFADDQIDKGCERLERLIQLSPMTADGYDLLAHYYFLQGRYDDAIDIADQVLQLTPHASHRALNLAKYAAARPSSSWFFDAATRFIHRVPVYNHRWLIELAQLCENGIELIERQGFIRSDNEFIRPINTLFNKLSHRLSHSDQKIARTLKAITLSRIALIYQQPAQAQRILMQGLSPYFHQLGQIHDVLLSQSLVPLLKLGEIRFALKIYQHIQGKEHKLTLLQDSLSKLRDNAILLNEAKRLSEQLSAIQKQGHSELAIAHYNHLLRQYPYCTEAHLGRLLCYHQLAWHHHDDVKASFRVIRDLPLCEPLASQKQQVWRAYAMAPEPATPSSENIDNIAEEVENQLLEQPSDLESPYSS